MQPAIVSDEGTHCGIFANSNVVHRQFFHSELFFDKLWHSGLLVVFASAVLSGEKDPALNFFLKRTPCVES